jgi:hypothetical protein
MQNARTDFGNLRLLTLILFGHSSFAGADELNGANST